MYLLLLLCCICIQKLYENGILLADKWLPENAIFHCQMLFISQFLLLENINVHAVLYIELSMKLFCVT